MEGLVPPDQVRYQQEPRGTGTRRCRGFTPGYDFTVRTYSAQVVPDEVVIDRAVRTSLRRGPHDAVVVCGRCDMWLAVGHLPDDDLQVLLACSSCGAVNDPGDAIPVPDGTGESSTPPGPLAAAEIWVKSAVERVHALAAQEQRWPWRAGTG